MLKYTYKVYSLRVVSKQLSREVMESHSWTRIIGLYDRYTNVYFWSVQSRFNEGPLTYIDKSFIFSPNSNICSKSFHSELAELLSA